MDLFVVTAVLEPETPVEFARADWPLHVTVSSNFRIERDPAEILAELRPSVHDVAPFRIRGGESRGFGPRGDIAVTLVDPPDVFVDIHLRLVRVLTDLGAIWTTPFTGDRYVPHATITATGALGGERIAVDRLGLFRLTGNLVTGRARVEGWLGLSG
jgi:2'-5' RNA ligase